MWSNHIHCLLLQGVVSGPRAKPVEEEVLRCWIRLSSGHGGEGCDGGTSWEEHHITRCVHTGDALSML